MIRRLLIAVWLLLLATMAHSAPEAASLGTLRGRVVDRDGHPLAGAMVVLVPPPGAGSERMSTTDALGNFSWGAIPPGAGYALSVSLPSYPLVRFTDVEVGRGENAFGDIVLRPAMTERVEVRSTPDIVETDTAVSQTRISSQFLQDLPILGRDYQDILVLAPGVTDVNKTGNPNIHGARDVDVLTLVDGVNTTDPFSGLYGQEMNAESIAEIEVITAGATAQYGRAQGGFINILTRSGGNDFQGTFKLFTRSYRLDGDGAGIDPVELRGNLGDADGFRGLRFTDLYPFISVSGPLVRDRLWYFLAPEFAQIEDPVNAGTQAYIARTRSLRGTGKMTWQMTPSSRLGLTLLYDDTTQDNQGLDSRTQPESGYTFERGGPTFTLQHTALLGTSLSLESSLSRLDQSFSVVPSLEPDTNHNGVLFVDGTRALGGNQDGFLNPSERDSGEDFDEDGRFDTFEDFNRNGTLDGCVTDARTGDTVCNEDLDQDGRLTGPFGCEGNRHEDLNCNGLLDAEGDLDMDGVVDPSEDRGIPCSNATLCPQGFLPGTAGNGAWDTEDRNGNHRLDTVDNSGFTPFPFWTDRNGDRIPDDGEFLSPLPADEDYLVNLGTNQTTGPFYFGYSDQRTRDTLREDLSIFVADAGGSHDLRLGGAWEQEGFSRERWQLPLTQLSGLGRNVDSGSFSRTMGILVPTTYRVENRASGNHLGLFIQDSYKPLPSLTLGLGLRFDREDVEAWGYAPFDPMAERGQFDSLMGLAGVEVGTNFDLNQDGISDKGFVRDPTFGNQPLRDAQRETALKQLALKRFTRHNYLTSILSSRLTQFGIDDPLQLSSGTPRQRQDFSITNNNLAPRLSVSWDPRSNGKSKVFASWGRFYGNLFLQTVVGEQGPDLLSPYYVFDPDGVSPSGQPDHKVGSTISYSPPSATQVDRNLKTPFSDELTLGWEQEIAPEVSVSLTYVRRSYREQLQDIDVNHTVRRAPFCMRGTTPDGLCDDYGLTLVPRSPNLPSVRLPDGYPDLHIENLEFNQVFRVGNYNHQAYDSYELHFVRRLRRKWQLDASYVYSKATGQAESFLSESGDDPALTELKSGYLSYDQRHVAKLHAIAYLPADWQLGGAVNWTSGLPYSFVNRFQSNDNAEFIQTRRLFGQRDINSGFFYAEHRNTHRNHSAYDLSARLRKNFVMGHSAAGAFFEIYNLLNTDDLRVNEIDNRNATLQADEIREFGRRFQIGLQIQF